MPFVLPEYGTLCAWACWCGDAGLGLSVHVAAVCAGGLSSPLGDMWTVVTEVPRKALCCSG